MNSTGIILVSPQGHLTAWPADSFRDRPDAYPRRWQRLTSVRLPAGVRFEQVREQVYGWAVWTYRL